MPDENPPAPTPGTLVVDTSRKNLIAEFRDVIGPFWALRPVCGGLEWEADPALVRLPDPTERLHAETARCNARSRGALLLAHALPLPSASLTSDNAPDQTPRRPDIQGPADGSPQPVAPGKEENP